MRHVICAAAALSLAVAGVGRAASITINSGDTVTLNIANDTLTADTIVNNGTIVGDSYVVHINAGTSLTNNGTIQSNSAAVRVETPTVVHNGVFKSTGVAATIDLNGSGSPVQTVTGTGSWDIDNGMNAYGKFDVQTTGEFYAHGGAVIGLGGVSDSKFSMSNLGGEAGSRFSMGANSTLTILNGDASKAFAGDIEGGMKLVKNGAGTQVLTGSVTHTGGTEINAGVLEVHNAANTLGYGTVNVNDGGTLAGEGNVQTFTVVGDGGRLAPGTGSGEASISFFGLRLLAGSALDVDLASSGPSDLVSVYNSGTHAGGTTVNVANAGLTAGSTVWFFQFANTVIVDADNNFLSGDVIDASDFTLGTLSAGLTGHLVSEYAEAGGLSFGRVGFFVDSVAAAPSAVPLPAAAFGAVPLLGLLAARRIRR